MPSGTRFHLDVLSAACISGWGQHDGEPLTLLVRVNGRQIARLINDPALGTDLSTYYRATFNTFANIRGVVTTWFDVVDHFPRTLLDQDTLVLQRR